MKKGILILRIFAVMMSVIMMVLIFNFSADNAEESGKKSEEVTVIIVQTVEPEIVEKPIEEQQKVYDSVGTYVRKSAHFIEFAALGFFMSLMVNTIYLDYLRRFLLPLGCGALYALTDEFHQLFVPGRAFSFIDVLIDSGGVLIGILLSIAIFAIFKRISLKKAQK